jgi:hypothetical protein
MSLNKLKIVVYSTIAVFAAIEELEIAMLSWLMIEYQAET